MAFGRRLRLARPAIGAAAALAVFAFSPAGYSAPEERLRPGFPADAVPLLEEAERLMNSTPARALELTAEVLAHPDGEFSPEFLARLHYVRARASTHAGSHAEAIAEGEVALELLSGRSPQLRADILTTMAISLGRSRETRRAYELLQEALRLQRDLADNAGEATSLSAVAELYYDIGLAQKGAAVFEEAVSRARDANDDRVLAVTLNNFAYFLQGEGDHARAAPLLDEALTLVDRAAGPRLAAYVMLNAANAYYHTGRPAEAEALLRRGLPMAEEFGQAVLLLAANLTEANLARDRGALEDARKFGEAALAYARDIKSERRMSEITKLLADVAERAGDHAAAYRYLAEHAVHLAADAESASDRSAALFEAETLLGEREQEVELLRRDSEITKLAVARAEILRNTAIIGALLLAGAVISLFLLLREKARAKEIMDVKNRELIDAYGKLAAADRNKSNFLSVMSHELKTPLNSIIGFSDLLAKANGENASTVEFAKIINVQGRNLLRMVSEILLFTGAADKALALDETPERLSDIFAASTNVASEMRQDALARIAVEAAEDVCVTCDLQQLANCVARLLDNALKFSPAGTLVTLGARRTDAGVEISVGDEGPGVDRNDAPRLAGVLAQGDQSLARRQQGAGLGLPVASRIAEAHGGYIALGPRRPCGTIACVVLPAARLAFPAKAA